MNSALLWTISDPLCATQWIGGTVHPTYKSQYELNYLVMIWASKLFGIDRWNLSSDLALTSILRIDTQLIRIQVFGIKLNDYA